MVSKNNSHTNGAAPTVSPPEDDGLMADAGETRDASSAPGSMSPPVGGLRGAAPVTGNGAWDGDWHQHNLATDSFSKPRPIVRRTVEEPLRGNGLIANEAPIHVEDTPPEFARLFAGVERQLMEQIANGALAQSGVLAADAPFVLGVTSAAAGEGKTTIALHLALSAARNSAKRVCLIDLSLGDDALCARLGVLPPEQGVVNVLEDKDQTLTTLKLTGGDDLVIMPAGRAPANAAKLARSARVGELLSAARENFDIIVVDMPAVATDNAAPLVLHTDGVLLVACAGVTPKSAVRTALKTIGNGDKVLGVVLNRVRIATPRWLLRRMRF